MSTYTQLLRTVADLIDEHGLCAAHILGVQWVTVHTDSTMVSPRVEAAKWRRALGGEWKKRDQNDTIVIEQRHVKALPGNPDVSIFLDKSACTRRVVGVEEVVIPAVEAQPERTEKREIVEWDCEPVLARAS